MDPVTTIQTPTVSLQFTIKLLALMLKRLDKVTVTRESLVRKAVEQFAYGEKDNRDVYLGILIQSTHMAEAGIEELPRNGYCDIVTKQIQSLSDEEIQILAEKM